jgi:hypothetical protein
MCIAFPLVTSPSAMALVGSPVGVGAIPNGGISGVLPGSPPAASVKAGPAGFDTMAGQSNCYGSSGLGAGLWETARKVATLTISAANAAMQAELGYLRMSLGEKWYDMAKSKYDRWNGRYRPTEKNMVTEVTTVAVPTLNCPAAKARARASVNTAYDSIGTYMARQAKMMRLCLDSTCTLLVDQKRAVTAIDTENYNLGDEQWYTDFKTDQRWNRRSTILNLGRNLSSMSQSYGQVAMSTMDRVGQQVEMAGNSAASALGYTGARNDTYWPQNTLQNGASDVIADGAGNSPQSGGASPHAK